MIDLREMGLDERFRKDVHIRLHPWVPGILDDTIRTTLTARIQPKQHPSCPLVIGPKWRRWLGLDREYVRLNKRAAVKQAEASAIRSLNRRLHEINRVAAQADLVAKWIFLVSKRQNGSRVFLETRKSVWQMLGRLRKKSAEFCREERRVMRDWPSGRKAFPRILGRSDVVISHRPGGTT